MQMSSCKCVKYTSPPTHAAALPSNVFNTGGFTIQDKQTYTKKNKKICFFLACLLAFICLLVRKRMVNRDMSWVSGEIRNGHEEKF